MNIWNHIFFEKGSCYIPSPLAKKSWKLEDRQDWFWRLQKMKKLVWILHWKMAPGSQSNSLKSLFEQQWLLFFLRFQARFFPSGDGFLESGLNLQRDCFFLRRFQEMVPLRAEFLVRMNFFFRYFHEIFRTLTKRCDFEFDLFDEFLLVKRWMETLLVWFFGSFCDEVLFFWDKLFLKRRDLWGRPLGTDGHEIRFSHFFFHPVPKKWFFKWSWRLLITQLPKNCRFIEREVETLVLQMGSRRFSLRWDGDDSGLIFCDSCFVLICVLEVRDGAM